VRESFLEDINNMLNAGEVPNLMETEDMERLLNLTRPLAKAAGKVTLTRTRTLNPTLTLTLP